MNGIVFTFLKWVEGLKFMQRALFLFVHSRSRVRADGWVEIPLRHTCTTVYATEQREHLAKSLDPYYTLLTNSLTLPQTHTVSSAQVIITHSYVRERQADRPFSSLNRGDASRHQQRSRASADRRLLCAELVFSVREPCSTAIPHPAQRTTLPNSHHCCAICQLAFIHLKVIGANVWLKRSLFFRGGGENRGRW